jgi:hypothetical protein
MDKMAAMMVPFVQDEKTAVMDHLGVFLAEKILDLDLGGKTRTIFITQNEDQGKEDRAVESVP